MTCPGNGIYVVQGEMAILLTAMRRGARWSSHSHQDEDQDVLIRSFSDLKDILNQIGDLRELDPNHYLGPFLEVIRSEETTGPVTSLALSAVNKFLSYRLIDPAGKSVPATVENIADAVTHARFVGTDQASDGVVLMKILQVLRTLMLSPEGIMLTNESVCEIMLSVFRICFESRLSELLRRSAEHSLKDMVQLLFSRLPQFSEDLRMPLNIKKLKMRPSAMDSSRGKRRGRTSLKGKQNRPSAKSDQTTPTTNQKEKPPPSELENITLPTGEVCKEEVVTPIDKLGIASSLHAGHLSTTPMTPAGNIVDMQGAISQCTPLQSDGQQESLPSPSDVTVNATNEEAPQIVISAHEDSPNGTDSIKTNPFDNSSANSVENKLSEEKTKESDGEVGKAGESFPDEKMSQTVVVCNADEEGQEYVNPRGVRFTSPENGDGNQPLMPYGVVCVRELFRFLVSLCNPVDKQNTETMIHLGLTLLTVALEIGADSIGKYSSFLSLVKDELCRNLFSLLNLERLSIFAADLQVSFLLFESMRTHLKFQLEFYLNRLMEIIISDSTKITYEQREIALDAVVQLWRIPGLVTELYLNYDCDLYCPNLFEDLTKLLSKNAFPVTGVYNTHLLSLDALLTVIDTIEGHCHRRILSERHDEALPSPAETCTFSKLAALVDRQRVSEHIPSHEQLMAIKCKKKLLTSGTEHFNSKPKKGVEFLQDHGLLSTDPMEVVTLLRENPRLDKKQIGEYISSRNNLAVLDCFVKSFDFTDTRIDEALRCYLEAFRLPGESPLISLIMEHFAEHWHKCNQEPFANADAAFTLSYAVIMLNVDQHNYNVKRQNNPMTCDEFKRNLKKVNGGEDFDQDMLDEIYVAIKTDEIVMPAEQTGIVRENYLWKVLLRRGNSKDGLFIHAPNGLFDHDLFSLIWGPTVAALSFMFDKTTEVNIYHKAMAGFRKCAMISAHYGMSGEFDHLIVSLCKFSSLCNSGAEPPDTFTIAFGSSAKCQLAAATLFSLAHRHGDIMRQGWRNILDIMLQLYRCKLLPTQLVEAEDFIDPDGKISLIREETPLQKAETGLLSSLYSYIALSSESASAKVPSPEDQEAMRRARHCILECHLEQLVTESKFLRLDSLDDLIKALIAASQAPSCPAGSVGFSYDEGSAVFFMELLLKVAVQNRDRVTSVWQAVRDHMYTLVMGSSACDCQYLLERSIVGLLRLAIKLMRREDMSPVVLQSLRMLLLLKSTTLFRVSRQISYGLYELLKTSAANIHSDTDWSIIFTLLECVGGGAPPPRVMGGESRERVTDATAKSDSELAHEDADSGVGTERGYTSDSELSRHRVSRPTSPEISPNNGGGGWILVGPEGEIQPVCARAPPANQFSIVHERELLAHDPYALVKCCESVAFLVRDVAHITPYNFENCVHCIRTFVEASLNGVEKKSVRTRSAAGKDKPRKKSTSGRRKEENGRAKSPQPANNPYDADESDSEELPGSYSQISLQLLDLMHTLHTRTAQIYKWWAEESGADLTSLWAQGWCPLLQGIARLCTDSRKQVRTSAITYLQRALLVHDLQTLTASEWESCFNQVLFPLLAKLLEPISAQDVVGVEETRMRAATVLAKVFLHHLTPLQSLPTFTALWLTILDFMDKYMHADRSDLLYEAIPESLKNMLLVMDSANVFTDTDGYSQLWVITWDRINTFLPHMRDELFKSHPSVDAQARHNGQESQPPVISSSPDLQSGISRNFPPASGEGLSFTEQSDSVPIRQVRSEPSSETSSPRATSLILQPPTTASDAGPRPTSIILQPPTAQPANNPIFTHIGQMGTQMVSTAIGPPASYIPPAQHYPVPLPQPTVTAENIHPALYDQPAPQPVPLFASFASSFDMDANPVSNQTTASGSNIPAHYFYRQEPYHPPLFQPSQPPQLYSSVPITSAHGSITSGNVIQTIEDGAIEDL